MDPRHDLKAKRRATMCVCGHTKSQHHVREDGGRRICDYSGYACECKGYVRMKEEESDGPKT